MTRIIRLFSISILSVIIFGIVSPQDILACYRGPLPPIEEYVDRVDAIVRGQIIETDDSGQNMIMKVTEYLKGEGNEIILLSNFGPSVILEMNLNYESNCSYGLMPIPEDEELILFLYSGPYGSYRLESDYIVNPNEEIYVFNDSLGDYRVVTYAEFIDFIQNYIGTDPILPFMDTLYPLSAPMLITTESGTEYILPIDGNPPVALSELNLDEPVLEWFGNFTDSCWDINCYGRANHQIDIGRITSEGIFFESNPFRLDGVGSTYLSIPYSQLIENGRAFIFSPLDIRMVAIWKNPTSDNTILEDSIILQILHYAPQIKYELINEMPLKMNTIYPNSAAWSPNGRLLAFADIDGIYLWDVFVEDAKPVLIYETNIKTIEGFSPLGRYLVIGDKDEGLALDLVSGNTYPIGVFSPSERYLMAYKGGELIGFTPYIVTTVYDATDVDEIIWLSDYMWMGLSCHVQGEEKSCFLVNGFSREGYRTIANLSDIPINGFDYDLQTDMFGVATNGFHLEITHWQWWLDFREFTLWKEYDLSPYLDSPIASIEWLPSLFYYDD